MKFSDHYTNPLVSWLLSSNENYKRTVYDLTGMNLYKRHSGSTLMLLTMSYLFWFIGVTFVIIAMKLEIPVGVGTMIPVILLRVLIPTTPYQESRGGSYRTALVEDERRRFGGQVTPSWFIVFWYGILRMGRWTLKYTLCVAFQFGVAGLLMWLIPTLVVPDHSVIFGGILILFGVYMYFVYRFED